MILEFQDPGVFAHAASNVVAYDPAQSMHFQLFHLAQGAGLTAESVVETYMHALEANGAVVDSSTASALYIAGKLTSGAISRQRQTLRWLVNWASIGIIDGLFTHSWYHFIQHAFESWNLDLGPVSEALLLTAISSAVYTPLYCAGFLSLLSLVEVTCPSFLVAPAAPASCG